MVTVEPSPHPIRLEEAVAEPAWIKKGRVPSLDGLRCVSILLVLFAHMGENGFFRFPIPLGVYETIGAIGVDVFFVISGFLITLLLIREQQRTDRISLPAFYSRRCLRILPAYVTFLLCVFALASFGFLHPSRWDWIGMLTYTANFVRHPSELRVGHLWSLSLEEHFYLFWPAVLILVGLARARWVLLAIVGATPFVRLFISHYLSKWLDIDFCTFARMDTIAVGCLLAFAAQEPAYRARLKHLLLDKRFYALGLLALLVASVGLGQISGKYTILLEEVVNSVVLGLLVWFCVNTEGTTARVLNTKTFVFIGTLSYSIYIWQQLFLQSWHDMSMPARCLVYLIAVAAASAGSYFLIERPFLQMKSRMGSASPAPREAIPVPE
jgi:peptidoglycan/LPS O-acetylase OafA/YrhL